MSNALTMHNIAAECWRRIEYGESFGLIYDTLRTVGQYGTDVEYQELKKKQLHNVKMSLVAEIEEDKKLCVLSIINRSKYRLWSIANGVKIVHLHV